MQKLSQILKNYFLIGWAAPKMTGRIKNSGGNMGIVFEVFSRVQGYQFVLLSEVGVTGDSDILRMMAAVAAELFQLQKPGKPGNIFA